MVQREEEEELQQEGADGSGTAENDQQIRLTKMAAAGRVVG